MKTKIIIAIALLGIITLQACNKDNISLTKNEIFDFFEYKIFKEIEDTTFRFSTSRIYRDSLRIIYSQDSVSKYLVHGSCVFTPPSDTYISPFFAYEFSENFNLITFYCFNYSDNYYYFYETYNLTILSDSSFRLKNGSEIFNFHKYKDTAPVK